MKGLRYDLVLSLVVIASHYNDVLVDLLNVQLQQPSSTPIASFSMMAAHDASQLTDSPPIHPQALSNWKADNYRQQLYVLEPVFFTLVNNVLQDYYTWSGTPENIQHKILISIGSVPIPKLVLSWSPSRKNVTTPIYHSLQTTKLSCSWTP